MMRISKLGLSGIILGALALSASVAQAQDAKKGKAIYTSKGCGACHTINKPGSKMAGPDLGGVTQRRSPEWLKRWLKDPGAMFGNDSTADAILAEAKNIKMPNLKLSDGDIASLIAYLAENPKP
jgi:cytochrome c2